MRSHTAETEEKRNQVSHFNKGFHGQDKLEKPRQT